MGSFAWRCEDCWRQGVTPYRGESTLTLVDHVYAFHAQGQGARIHIWTPTTLTEGAPHGTDNRDD